MLDAVYNGIKLFCCAVNKMTVYVDILVALNTLVNYFILLAVKKITRENTSRLRIALGALMGGGASLLIFIEDAGIWMTLIKILTSVLMIFISFKTTSFKRFLKNTAWLFFITFIFGGLMLAVYLSFGIDSMIYTNGIIYFNIDMTFLVVCSVLSYILISVISYLIDKKAPKKKEYYVTLENKGKSVACTALMDTGNNLREPFSGYPVIMVDQALFDELFGKNVEAGNRVRLIPISTVGGEKIVKAYRPEHFKAENYVTDRIYVAQSIAPLDEYKIILNINLEGEIENEKNQVIAR